MSAPAEIHHQLLGFSYVDLEAVPLTPVHKVIDQFSVFPVIVVSDEADDGRVIRELLQVTVCKTVPEVCSVQGEQERSQD